MRKRTAFTLLEILLVLVILIIAVSLALPMADSMYRSAKTRAAADAIRAALLNARTHAMNESRSYRFSMVPGGVAYRVAPDDDTFWSGSGQGNSTQGNAMPTTSASGVLVQPPYIFADNIPAGIRFDGANGAVAPPPTPGASPTVDPPAETIDAGQFATQVVFSSDGSADVDLRMVLQLPGAQPLVLTLRGMTGVVTVKPLSQDEGAPNQ